MVDYREIKNPRALKGVTISADDEGLSGGVDAAIGLDTGEGKPGAQLDIRYRDNASFVSLMVHVDGGLEAQEHWRFTGFVSPNDCRENWSAAQADTIIEAKAVVAEATAE